ncbi:MAG: hydroxyacylglutathione hydrolase [Deltaproteobacteria bacterium]|nr:hydroxyacylglutathione hydrolase [Deltaproteobacteria bacterium]
MRVVTVPILSDNYSYLVICDETRRAAVVDPGEADPIRRALRDEGVELEAILCTHHHGDHVAAVEAFSQEGRCRVYGPASEGGRLPALSHPLEDGGEVAVGRLRGRVMATPGHTLGSAVYLFEGAVFTGDTLFGGGCGRLFEGDAPTLYASLQRLAALPPETELYFGHEYTLKNLQFARGVDPENPDLLARIVGAEEARAAGRPTVPSTVALERATNPFLRCGEGAIVAHLGLDGAEAAGGDPVGVFARLRELRNVF